LEIKNLLLLSSILFINLIHIPHSIGIEIIEESAVKESKGNHQSVERSSRFTKSKLKYYQNDNITNQIPYFDNRFRIDAQLDEVTLLFYRKRGSRPIILVRPDGSKIRIDNFDKEQVQWFADSTFDMITVKKPMPGPWQAIGDILPKSQVMVLSDVKIAVEPLPEIIFSGETLKVVGQLYNGKELIDTPSFREVVKLGVHFYSTNNSTFDNFGADAVKLVSFKDDGKNLDEYAADGLFTGEFTLDFSAGEWQPVYFIKLPMATRELRQKSIILHKTPIHINVEASGSEDTPHVMTVTIDPTYVIADSLVFQGKVTFPDRQTEPFSIMDDQQGETRIHHIGFTEPGLYRVNLNAFGKTLTGREFRLVMPEFSFNVQASKLEQIFELDENGVQQVITQNSSQTNSQINPEQLLAEQEAKLALEKQVQQEAEEKQQHTIIMIVAGNSVIIIVALVLFIVVRKKKKVNKLKIKASL